MFLFKHGQGRRLNTTHATSQQRHPVFTTIVKAISGYVYGRKRKEEPSEEGDVLQRSLSSTLHGKRHKRKGRGVYISDARYFMETMTDSHCSDYHSAQYSTAQTLPEDVLLEIFHCHRQAAIEYGPWKWHRLAQVCQRWRSVVFAYPRHLNLRIVLTYAKSIRSAPKLWPVLPVIIWYPHPQTASHPIRVLTSSDEDNISDMLKNPARICEIDLDITRTLLEKYASLLEESLPALDHLRLRSHDIFVETMCLSINFLNHSAPQLRVLHLKGITIPMSRLSRLLSSSKNLVSLQLEDIILSGSLPAAVDLVIGLSTATQLKSLILGFNRATTFPHFGPLLGCPSPSSSRIVLPSLTEFRFVGDSAYLRYFDSRVNTPIIEKISLTPFYDSYDTNELCELFGLGDVLRSSRCRATRICLSLSYIVFSHHFSRIPSSPALFQLRLPYLKSFTDIPLVAQVCHGLESQDALSKVIHLEIDDCPHYERYRASRWFYLLRALTGLKALYVCSSLSSLIVSALAQVTASGERIREILPALKELHFGLNTPSSTRESIAPFIAQRWRCGLPVSVYFNSIDGRLAQLREWDISY